MKRKAAFEKHLGRLAGGVLGVALASNFGLAQAQSPSKSQPVEKKPSEITVVSSPAQLNLNQEAEPILPPELEQSKQPGARRRGIVGTDDRVPMTSSAYPWSAIGRIVGITAEGKGYTCTGALIADSLVLTNAHCVVNPYTRQKSRVIAFEPNLIGGRLQDEADRAFTKAVAYGTDFQDSSDPPQPDDWAVLAINRPLGYKYGTLRWQPLPTSVLIKHPGQFLTIGYSGDFPAKSPGETASVHVGCSIVGETEEILTHDCDVTGGSSGSPILGWINNEVRIVGLISAEARNPNNQEVVNFAVKISRILEWLREGKKP